MDVSFVAGFWCGEGYVSIERSTNSSGKYSYGIRCGVSNCDLTILESIQNTIGYGVIQRKSKKPNWRQGYDLRFTSIAAIDFCKTIQPYVVGEKLKKIDLFIEYGTKYILQKGRISVHGLNDEKEVYYQKMKSMNLKGIHYVT